jgi:hypothetical protein
VLEEIVTFLDKIIDKLVDIKYGVGQAEEVNNAGYVDIKTLVNMALEPETGCSGSKYAYRVLRFNKDIFCYLDLMYIVVGISRTV